MMLARQMNVASLESVKMLINQVRMRLTPKRSLPGSNNVEFQEIASSKWAA
jgi:hypothetical protein